VWQRLFSLTAASRVLNYLSARLVERTFGSTWLTAVSGCSWQRWNPAVPTTDRPIASLLHGDPRGPWRQPRDVRSTVLSWQTRCLGVDVPVHGGAPTIERHDTAWLALPEATIVSPVGAVVINHAQPSDLGQRMMPVHDAPGYWLDVVDRTAAGRDGEVRRTAASTVVLYDSFITSYYHCLIDYLPRVVTARELIEDHGFTIAVPTTSAATLGAVLEAFGWGYALHPVEAAPEMFDWVAVIGGCQLGIEADPDAVRWLASEAHARFGGQGPRRRLLISRADASNRRLLNEAALMALLEPHGFERVLPSTLSVAEQLSAFAAAEIVVAPHGAALANLVAARPGTRVVEITADLSLCKFYAPIAAVLGLDHTTVLARGVEADLEVNPALVLAALGYTTP
jgi:capsular polysaccharide biosynthesis protein